MKIVLIGLLLVAVFLNFLLFDFIFIDVVDIRLFLFIIWNFISLYVLGILSDFCFKSVLMFLLSIIFFLFVKILNFLNAVLIFFFVRFVYLSFLSFFLNVCWFECLFKIILFLGRLIDIGLIILYVVFFESILCWWILDLCVNVFVLIIVLFGWINMFVSEDISLFVW